MEGNVLLGTKGWANPDHPSLGFLDKAYLNTLIILPLTLPSNHAISTFFSHLLSTFLYSYWLIFSTLAMLAVPSDVGAGWWQTWISVPAVLGFVSLKTFLWAFSYNFCTFGIFTYGFFDIFIASLAPLLFPTIFKLFLVMCMGGVGCECPFPLRPDASDYLVAGTTGSCEPHALSAWVLFKSSGPLSHFSNLCRTIS